MSNIGKKKCIEKGRVYNSNNRDVQRVEMKKVRAYHNYRVAAPLVNKFVTSSKNFVIS